MCSRALKAMFRSGHFAVLLIAIAWCEPAVCETDDRFANPNISEAETRARLKNLYLQQDEHQISLSVGRLAGRVVLDQQTGTSDEVETTSTIGRIHYCFFIPQAKWLALGLGSSMGLELRENTSKDLKAGRSFHLPGILIAANVRFSNDWQMMVGMDQVIERWEGFEFFSVSEKATDQSDKQKISMNLRMTDLMISFLRTLESGWGIHFEAHRRFGRFFRPAVAEGFAVNTVLTHQDLWVGSGLTYLIH